MRRKAPLSLMELMVMIAVFALAAALCLQAFVKSDRISHRMEARDRAAILCQSAAECVRLYDGDLPLALEKVAGPESVCGDGEGYLINYDDTWKALPREDSASPAYILRLTEIPCGVEGLGKALVEAFICGEDEQEMESLFSIEISWQKEVANYG